MNHYASVVAVGTTIADRPRTEPYERHSACAGSSTTQDRLLARVYRETAVLPSSNQERVGVLVLRFSKLNSPAHPCPCLRFKRHLAMPPARLRAKMESLSPFL